MSRFNIAPRINRRVDWLVQRIPIPADWNQPELLEYLLASNDKWRLSCHRN